MLESRLGTQPPGGKLTLSFGNNLVFSGGHPMPFTGRYQDLRRFVAQMNLIANTVAFHATRSIHGITEEL